MCVAACYSVLQRIRCARQALELVCVDKAGWQGSTWQVSPTRRSWLLVYVCMYACAKCIFLIMEVCVCIFLISEVCARKCAHVWHVGAAFSDHHRRILRTHNVIHSSCYKFCEKWSICNLLHQIKSSALSLSDKIFSPCRLWLIVLRFTEHEFCKPAGLRDNDINHPYLLLRRWKQKKLVILDVSLRFSFLWHQGVPSFSFWSPFLLGLAFFCSSFQPSTNQKKSNLVWEKEN